MKEMFVVHHPEFLFFFPWSVNCTSTLFSWCKFHRGEPKLESRICPQQHPTTSLYKCGKFSYCEIAGPGAGIRRFLSSSVGATYTLRHRAGKRIRAVHLDLRTQNTTRTTHKHKKKSEEKTQRRLLRSALFCLWPVRAPRTGSVGSVSRVNVASCGCSRPRQ